MKYSVLLYVFGCACLLVTAKATLLDSLNAVHNNPAFQKLSTADQILIIELIAEVEVGEVKAYIDQVGFHHIISVIDKLPANEAHILTHLLTQELDKEEQITATSLPYMTTTTMLPDVVGKRDLATLLAQVIQNPTFQTLSAMNQTLIKDLFVSAESHNLTQLIDQVGYSTILKLVDVLPHTEAHFLDQYIYQHLQKETQTVG